MRPRWKRSFSVVLVLVAVAPMSAGCAEKQLGGMTAEQAFRDQRVARLVEAASRGDLAEADAQLRAGADVNAVGAQGMTPLIWVVTTHNLDAIEHLLKAGANPNYRDPERGFSAMYFAAAGNNPKILELLLKHGGDPNLRGMQSKPMLQAAVEQFREQNIEILLKHGADINGHTGLKASAADDAAAYGRYDLVVHFLERGLNYNLRGLAKSVEGRHVPAQSEQQRWKEKAIEMLKARGVKFPAFVRRVERDPSSQELKQFLEQAFPDPKRREAFVQKHGFPENAYYALKLEKIMPDPAQREAWLREYHDDARDAYNARMLELGKDGAAAKQNR